MRKHQLLFLTGLLLSLSLLTQSCGKRKGSAGLPETAYHPEISAFTAGVISNGSAIRVVLSRTFETGGADMASMAQTLFEFSPSIKGTAYWTDTRTIEFRPEERLKSGQRYTARFLIGKLVDAGKGNDLFEFYFQIRKQMFAVEPEGIETIDPEDGRWNRYTGRLTTSDFMDGEVAGLLLGAYQGKRKLPVAWEHDPSGMAHLFVIDSVERKGSKETLSLVWDGKPARIRQKGEKSIEIPPLGAFIVMDARVVQYPDQHVVVNFSDPLVRVQDMQGIVELQGQFNLRFQATGNRLRIYPASPLTGTITLNINPGLQSSLGSRFTEKYSASLVFEVIKPAVRLTGKGVIMPGNKKLVFPFEAVNLRAVNLRIIKIYEGNVGHFLQANTLDGDYQLKRAGRLIFHKTIALTSERPLDPGLWNAYSFDLSQLIVTEPGAIYRVEIGFGREHAIWPCGGESDSDYSLAGMESLSAENAASVMDYWDDPEIYWDSGDPYAWNDPMYNWEERDDPCSRSYYGRERSVSRNVLSSNLGIIAKGENGNALLFAVNDLLTTDPLPGVTLDIYNYQNILIGSVVTDKQGMARIDPAMKAFLLIARLNDQRGYLRLDEGSSLSLSRFDVAGQEVQTGIKGFIYGDRGVWRPGDTLHLVFVLEDRLKNLPANHPVIFELYNPMGQMVKSVNMTAGQNGFYYFKTTTSPDAPTGNWTAQAKVGGALFTKTLKIETIKPNRLKAELDFGTELLGPAAQDAKGAVRVNWLHGAPARGLRVHIGATLTQRNTSFKNYEAYIFDDPSRSFSSQEITLFDGKTDADGLAVFNPGISVKESAPGMLNAHFVTRIFEEGGDFSIDRLTLPYAPYPSYTGIRLPEGEPPLGMLLNDTDHKVDVVTLDADGKPLSRNNLQVQIFKIEWRWWWDASGESLASYMGSTHPQAVFTQTLSTSGGKGSFSFRIPHPAWGRYLVKVTDPAGGHSTGKLIYIDWPGWSSRAHGDDPQAATMLSIRTDKEKYLAGEEVHVTLPALPNGRALVSIESGSGILETYWIEANGEEMRFSFPATPQMTPNVYLHISFLQPHAQTVNDLPIRMYGVVPVFVEDPKARLDPVIVLPQSLKPATTATIKVRESNGRRMTYTLAVVDEGLLDLTRFKTPDIWNAFYAREALGVRTWDMYDLVVGAYGGQLEQVFSIGGDEDIVLQPQAQANRFVPMVKFLGPFTLEKGRTNTHQLEVPQYVGAVRAMLVAGDQGAYGQAEKTVPVKNPLMVLASFPRVLRPGESLKLPVTVFAMENTIKQVRVDVSVNNFLKVTSVSSRQLTFSQTGEQLAYFDLEAGAQSGAATIKVVASAGGERAEYEIEVDVRNPNPPVSSSVSSVIDPGKEWDASFFPLGQHGTNSAMLEFSTMPPVDFGRRLKYLLDYPHGCVEQLTSTAFPQLFLASVMEMDQAGKALTENNVKEAIRQISSYQLPDGGIRYWPGGNTADDWGSTYAGHFMLEAEILGYTLPARFRDNWVRFQRSMARLWTPLQQNDRFGEFGQADLLQAYRLYTLALAGTPEMGAMNRLREHRPLSDQARWRLAAAYTLSGQPEAAARLIDGITTSIPEYPAFNASFGSRERDKAMILETLTLMNRREEAVAPLMILSEALSGNTWLSTQTTAYALLAISRFAVAAGTASKMSVGYQVDGGAEKKIRADKPYYQATLQIRDQRTYGLRIRNEGESVLFARLIQNGVPGLEDVTAASNKLNLTVSYKDLSGNTLDIEKISRGTDFIAEVNVTNPGRSGHYTDLVLSQIFPSGWEIHNMRMDENVPAHQSSVPAYQDIRDDRVYTHFDLGPGQTKKFTVLVHAAYLGRYYNPGVFCEAMYDNSIYARLPGKWTEVVLPGR